MTKAQLETKLRNECLELLHETLDCKYGCDVLPVSASELALPVTDAEGNEKWILVKVSIPRGTRNGAGGYTPYDGYEANEEYLETLGEKAAKKEAAEAKKQAKIARDQAKRAEKQAVAEANKNLKELRKIKLTEKKEEGDDYSKEYAPHELADMLN